VCGRIWRLFPKTGQAPAVKRSYFSQVLAPKITCQDRLLPFTTWKDDFITEGLLPTTRHWRCTVPIDMTASLWIHVPTTMLQGFTLLVSPREEITSEVIISYAEHPLSSSTPTWSRTFPVVGSNTLRTRMKRSWDPFTKSVPWKCCALDTTNFLNILRCC